VVLDTTHPTTVARAMGRLDPRRTLFLVSTKSGTTPETLALFRLFYRRAEEVLGRAPGERFVAITDPGSPLVQRAAEHGFRRTFLNDPGFGGRYSALSLVGLVPAALLGLDVESLLDSGAAMAARCAASVPVDRNPAALLAAFLVAHAEEGRDKATFVLSPPVGSFGDWAEQLVAESTGKLGRGIVPIVGEPQGTPDAYGSDRVFLRFDERVGSPEPAIWCPAISPADLGGQFFLWEMATALAGHLLGVNPFDQPDVEAAKQATRDLLAVARSQGELPADAPSRLEAAALQAFVAGARPGDYIALLAYLDPLPELVDRLNDLRVALRDRTRCATTLGLGPRFLHSTGQLHKGDGGRGLFLVLVDEPRVDLDVPEDGGRAVSLGSGSRRRARSHRSSAARPGAHAWAGRGGRPRSDGAGVAGGVKQASTACDAVVGSAV
jgi:hypothetical protein